jgi:hypothetical protein
MFLAKKLNKGAGTPAPTTDAQFNQVTMLLHGDGTNGAQNNTFIDSSTSNLTITRNGNTTQGSFSPYGDRWSTYFDGVNDLITIGDATQWSLGSDDFTIEFFYYPVSNTTADIQIIGQWTSGSTDESWAVGHHWTYGLVFFWTTNGSTDQSIGSTSTAFFTLNSWNHVAVSKSGTTVSLYLNGVRTNTGTLSGSISDSTRVLDIGGRTQSGANKIQGYLSNVRVVKYTAVYNPSQSTLTVPTAPLTDFYGVSLLTCQSSRYLDNSAAPRSFTINGAPSIQRFNPFGASTAYSTSVIGGSGYFDGAGDSLIVGNPSVNSGLALGSNDFTIQAWIYPLGTDIYTILGSLNNSSGNGSYWLMVNGTYSGGGIIQFGYNYVSGGSGGNDVMISTGTLKVGAWSFIAVTREGANIRGYVNGVQVGSTNNSIGSRTIYPTNQNLYIGRNVDSDAYAMKGYLSDVQLINGTALYTGSTMTVPTAPASPVTNTTLLTKFQNAAIIDNAMMNDLETVGNAQISTSVKKYGTGSLAFDGTGDYLTAPNIPSSGFGTGDFTIEFWLYVNSFLTYQTVVATRESGSPADKWTIGYDSGGSIYLYSNGFFGQSATGVITTGSWIYVAIVRASSTIKTYVNGTQSGSSSSNTQNFIASPVGVGAAPAGTEPMNGYIDDLRITKGYARYTANFTPPTAALPDIGPV